MSTDTINRASLTQALVRYLRRILDEQPLPGDGGLLRVPSGRTGARVAGQAARLGLITVSKDMVARVTQRTAMLDITDLPAPAHDPALGHVACFDPKVTA